MAHYLSARDIAEVCEKIGYPEQARAIEAAMLAGAHVIASHYDIAVTTGADNEIGFGGLLVGFGPGDNHPDKPCPEDLIEYDEGSGWAESTEKNP